MDTLVQVLSLPQKGLPTTPPLEDEEDSFATIVGYGLTELATADVVLGCPDDVERAVSSIFRVAASAYDRVAVPTRRVRRSKPWWNSVCSLRLREYHASSAPRACSAFRLACCSAKHAFFDRRIKDISKKSRRPWDLTAWAKLRRLPPTEALVFEGRACTELPNLWHALHTFFFFFFFKSSHMAAEGSH